MRAFDKNLRSVRLRCGLNHLFDSIAWGLGVCGGAAVAIVIAERLLALNLPLTRSLIALAALGLAASLVLWLRRFPTRIKTALLIDQRLGLRERFSTAVALSGCEDPFAAATVEDAHRTAEHISPSRSFPVRPSKRWAWTATVWTAAVLATLLPAVDLLGYGRQRAEEQREAEQLKQARSDLEEASQRVETAVARLDKPELAQQAAELQQIAESSRPAEVRREAIRKLGDLSDELRKTAGEERFQARDLLRDRLKNLRDTPGGLSSELYRALARGQFDQAGELLSELRRRMAEGDLSQEQMQALSRQFDDLSRQLAELGDGNQAVREQLRRAGIDEDVEGLSDEELRRLLRNQGLSNEQINELMRKLSACRSACRQCKELSNRLGRCAGSGSRPDAEEMAALLAQLSELERANLDAEALEAALAQIDEEIQKLGGSGANKANGLSLSLASAASPGGGADLSPGRDTPPEKFDDEKFDLESRLSPSQTHEGRVLATWYTRAAQIRGEARREFSDVVRASRDRAAEAIDRHEIPRRYESSVKRYFEQFADGETDE
ncbi:MAG: hypothetical protein ACP5HU_04230 [Phycisphaerae bacterium]